MTPTPSVRKEYTHPANATHRPGMSSPSDQVAAHVEIVGTAPESTIAYMTFGLSSVGLFEHDDDRMLQSLYFSPMVLPPEQLAQQGTSYNLHARPPYLGLPYLQPTTDFSCKDLLCLS